MSVCGYEVLACTSSKLSEKVEALNLVLKATQEYIHLNGQAPEHEGQIKKSMGGIPEAIRLDQMDFWSDPYKVTTQCHKLEVINQDGSTDYETIVCSGSVYGEAANCEVHAYTNEAAFFEKVGDPSANK